MISWRSCAALALVLIVACEDDPAVEPPREDLWSISPSRGDWHYASLPAEPADVAAKMRRFTPADRCFVVWHRPVPGVQIEDLAPWVGGEAGREVLPALQMTLVSNDPEVWGANEFGGVMAGSMLERDFSGATAFEFWLDDLTGDEFEMREGMLHFDFGWINEDFWWPRNEESPSGFEQYTFQNEDLDNNLVLGVVDGRSEDTGLDNRLDSEETEPLWWQRPSRDDDPAGDNFDASRGEDGIEFLYLNGEEANQRLDSEDLNGNTVFDNRDGYFTLSVDLADLDLAIVDVHRDYADFPEYLDEARSRGWAWRKYRIPISQLETRRAIAGDGYSPTTPSLDRIRFVRVWYQNVLGDELAPIRRFRFTKMRFVPREDEAPKHPLAVGGPTRP